MCSLGIKTEMFLEGAFQYDSFLRGWALEEQS